MSIFARAIEALHQGQRVRRTGWLGLDAYLVKAGPISTYDVSNRPIYLETLLVVHQDGKDYPWVPSQRDMLATDWEVLP